MTVCRVLLSMGVLFSLLSFEGAMAQGYKEYFSVQKIESTDARAAKQEAHEKATSEIILQRISDLMGQSRYKEGFAKIKRDVLPQKRKFIPFSRVLSQKPIEGGYEFRVQVKLSQPDLRKVLRTAGMLNSDSKTGIVLSFVEFNDHVNGESYRWWQPQNETKLGLRQANLDFEDAMAAGFGQRGMLFLKPETFAMVNLLPDFLKKGFLTQTEKVQIAGLKKSQLFLEGKVDVTESTVGNGYRIRFRLSCQQAGNGKSVAEVVRSLDIEGAESRVVFQKAVTDMAKAAGRDLGNQIYDLTQTGALETQILKLAVTGALDHRQMMDLKASISRNIAGVKSLREHLFEPGRVTFEVDYEGEGIESLRKQLGLAKFSGFFSQVVAANNDEVILDVKAKIAP